MDSRKKFRDTLNYLEDKQSWKNNGVKRITKDVS